jgi:P27 family predicted phage terminase small subunit
MNNEFEIPKKISMEAKQYMKNLLQELRDNGIVKIGLYHGGLIIIAITYHGWIKVAEIIEKEGLTITKKDDNGTTYTKIHPAVQIQHDYKTILNQWIEEFELIPGQLRKFKR